MRRLIPLENKTNSIIGITMMAIFLAGVITAHSLTNAPNPEPSQPGNEARTYESLKLLRKAYLDEGLTPPTTQDASNIGQCICNNIEADQPGELHHTQYRGKSAATAAAANYAYATLEICPGRSTSFPAGNKFRTEFEHALAKSQP